MSSFNYGNHTPQHIGIWLKTETNPELMELIKKSKDIRFFDTVERIVVNNYDKKTGEVILQVWCKGLISSILGKNRYNVFYVKTQPDYFWSCHGDLGRGRKFKNKKSTK
jgi:hypothetical protein